MQILQRGRNLLQQPYDIADVDDRVVIRVLKETEIKVNLKTILATGH